MWALVPGTVCVQSVLPVAASRQRSIRCRPSRLADWMNSLPFETIGDELPAPGSHLPEDAVAFAELDRESVSVAMPVAFGPRNCDQSAATAEVVQMAAAKRARTIRGCAA